MGRSWLKVEKSFLTKIDKKMRKSVARFDEAYNIVKDILTISSMFYTKGIVEANQAYDPVLVEDLCDREDGYTTLKLFVGIRSLDIEPRQYINIVCADASESGLFHLRNYIINQASEEFKSGLCSILDYLYRKGARRTSTYDRGRINNLLRKVKPGSANYLTPKGLKPEVVWFDMLRAHISEIEIIQMASGGTSNMSEIDKFLAQVMRSRNTIKTTEALENERRKFILSGGKL